MPLLAFTVGQPADRQQVGRVEQAQPVVERQPLACPQLVVDFGQTGRAET